jgi:hypothetical protein
MTRDQELEAMAESAMQELFGERLRDKLLRPIWPSIRRDRELARARWLEGLRAGMRLQAERDAKLVEGVFTGPAWDSEADSWAAHFAAAIRAAAQGDV